MANVFLENDHKNTGQTVSQLLTAKDNPIADVAYCGVTTGTKTGNEGVATAYNPAKFDEILDGSKDPDGKWFAIHYGSLGFFHECRRTWRHASTSLICRPYQVGISWYCWVS